MSRRTWDALDVSVSHRAHRRTEFTEVAHRALKDTDVTEPNGVQTAKILSIAIDNPMNLILNICCLEIYK